MIDLNTDKVILSKVVRRKAFILGKSVALARTEAALMDDGTVRIVAMRRPEHFLPGTPLNISFVAWRSADDDAFPQVVQRIREWEEQFITEELPELV